MVRNRNGWVRIGLAGLASIVVWGGWVGARPQEPAAKAPAGWVCPPCGCDSDEEVRAATGNCNSCGMALVDAASVPLVVVLLFEGVDLFSVAAPAAVFAHTARVVTVADTKDPIRTAGLGEIVPERTLAEVPTPDVLILPSGFGALQAAEDELVCKWVARAVQGARHVVPVSIGGVLLAKCGAVESLTLALPAESARHAGPILAGVTIDTEHGIHEAGKVIAARDATQAVLAACRVLAKISGREAAQNVAADLGIDFASVGAGK